MHYGTWVSYEAILLGMLWLAVVVGFLMWLSDKRPDNVKQITRRFFAFSLTMVLAMVFLVNLPDDLGVQLSGRSVTKVGSIFVGFPARSFSIPVGVRTYNCTVKLGTKSVAQISIDYTLIDAKKRGLFAVPTAQRYFDSVVVPYGDANHYVTQALNNAQIDSLCRGYFAQRKANTDSVVAMLPTKKAVDRVMQSVGMHVNKILIRKESV